MVNRRVKGAKVVGHYKRIEDMDDNWYRQFHVVVMGLDSIEARRYINKVYCSFLEFDRESGEAREGTWTPLIDGGTEGFKGHARVIIPGKTPCFECTTWPVSSANDVSVVYDCRDAKERGALHRARKDCAVSRDTSRRRKRRRKRRNSIRWR